MLEGNRLREYALAEGQWENNLLTYRAEMVHHGADWRHEVDLLDALIAFAEISPRSGSVPGQPVLRHFP